MRDDAASSRDVARIFEKEHKHIIRTIREMNYIGVNVASEAQVPWSVAKNYNYIHARK